MCIRDRDGPVDSDSGDHDRHELSLSICRYDDSAICVYPLSLIHISRMLLTDPPINSVAKASITDENFGSFGNDVNMWKFYNLLTGANKIHSYIDAFLDLSLIHIFSGEYTTFAPANKKL